MKSEPLTAPLIEAAITGKVSLGLYSVSETGTCKWTGFDVDRDEQWPQLVALAQHLTPQGHVILERSRRGGHLIAFHQPTYWYNAHVYGHALASQLGLDGIEIYPKFNQLHSLRMPGTRHVKTNVVYPIIHPLTGKILSLPKVLDTITPIVLPYVPEPDTSNSSEKSNGSNLREFPGSSTDFSDLVYEMSKLTRVRVYGDERAIACCPWHSDTNPSLFLKGRRMHCLSARCGVYGDAVDVCRFTERGILPPKG